MRRDGSAESVEVTKLKMEQRTRNLEDVTRMEEVLAIHAGRIPDAVALEGARGTLTYGQLWQAVEAQAAGLKSMGVQPGDRVVLVGENGIDLVVSFFAVLRAGAWAVNTSARLATPELERVIGHAQPRLVLFLEADSPEAQAHAEALAGPDRLPAEAGGWRLRRGTPAEDAQQAAAPYAERVATLVYTSGTTGTPKGAMLTHANLLYIARTLTRMRAYTPADRTYCVSPLSHVGGLVAALCALLYAGASLIVTRRFSPAELADAIDRRGLTMVSGVATLYVKFMEWVRANDWRPAHGNRIRMLTSSAGFFDPGVKREVETLFGLPLLNAYALTESAAGGTQTPLGVSQPAASAGVPLPEVQVRLADAETDQPTPAGQPGEIQMRGPNIFAGYYRNPQATDAAFSADGWFKSGDLGELDPEGNLRVLSRLKDVIKRAGFNVYPADIEQLLHEHPAIALSAVVGRRTTYDEEIIAFVQPRAGQQCTPEEIRAWLETRLASYKRPSRIVCMPELPALNNGKVDKITLTRSLETAATNA